MKEIKRIVEKAKKICPKTLKEEIEFWGLADYLSQLEILLKAEDKIMQCGLIYPAIEFVGQGIEATKTAIRNEIVHLSGLEERLKQILTSSNHLKYQQLNTKFKEWLKKEGLKI